MSSHQRLSSPLVCSQIPRCSLEMGIQGEHKGEGKNGSSMERVQPGEQRASGSADEMGCTITGSLLLCPSTARSRDSQEIKHELIYPRAAKLGLENPSQSAQILWERDQLGILERKSKGSLSSLVIRCLLSWSRNTAGFGTHKRADSWMRFNNLGAETAELPRNRKRDMERTSWTSGAVPASCTSVWSEFPTCQGEQLHPAASFGISFSEIVPNLPPKGWKFSSSHPDFTCRGFMG